MEIIRFEKDGIRYGELRGDEIIVLKGDLTNLEPAGLPAIALASVRLLAPVAPSKIVAVGPNFHATMKGGPIPPRPFLWIKPASTLLDPEGYIDMPPDVPMVCHESELAIVIGKTARDVSVADAADHILGYSCINDVSAGELTNIPAYVASQFFVDGKVFDTFAPLGPKIVTDIDPLDLRIQCRVNGETRQDHRTSDQIWNPYELVSRISHAMTLYPGDVIATGSPPNPGPFEAGDVIEVEIEGIGILRNHARAKGAL